MAIDNGSTILPQTIDLPLDNHIPAVVPLLESPKFSPELQQFERTLSIIPPTLRFNTFGSKENDEFSINVVNQDIGIFKSFSPVLLPFLETGTTHLLENNMEKLVEFTNQGSSLYESLTQLGEDGNEALTVLRERTKRCKENPSYIDSLIGQSVKSSRLADKRIFELYKSFTLSTDPTKKLYQQLAFLKNAFQQTAPFYELEGLLDDFNSDDTFNPFTGLTSNNELLLGQFYLDIAEAYLPSLLQDYLSESFTDIGRATIDTITRTILDTDMPVANLIIQIADTASVPLEYVVFAAFTLDHIGISSKTKVSKDEALQSLSGKFTQPIQDDADAELIRIGQKWNSFFRFQNWIPLSKNPTVFSGTGRNYASTSDIPNEIIDHILMHPELIKNEHQASFQEIIESLKKVDASSARGRFLLGVMQAEGRFKKIDHNDKIEMEIDTFLSMGLTDKKVSSLFTPLGGSVPMRSLIGGKTYGFYLRSDILNTNDNPNSLEVTSEFFDIVQQHDPQIKQLIQSIDTCELSEALLIGEQLRARITNVQSSLDPVVVQKLQTMLQKVFGPNAAINSYLARSSSAIEDSPERGVQPGVFDSPTAHSFDEILPSILQSYAACFSERAIKHFKLQGLSLTAPFSCLIQEKSKKPGGVIHATNETVTIEVADRLGNISHTQADEVFTPITFPTQQLTMGTPNLFPESLSEQQLLLVARLQNRLFEVLLDTKTLLETTGNGVDIEFLIDETVQFRQLPETMVVGPERSVVQELAIGSLEEISTLQEAMRQCNEGEAIAVSLPPALSSRHMLEEVEIRILPLLLSFPKTIKYLYYSGTELPQTSHIPNRLGGCGIFLSHKGNSND